MEEVTKLFYIRKGLYTDKTGMSIIAHCKTIAEVENCFKDHEDISTDFGIYPKRQYNKKTYNYNNKSFFGNSQEETKNNENSIDKQQYKPKKYSEEWIEMKRILSKNRDESNMICINCKDKGHTWVRCPKPKDIPMIITKLKEISAQNRIKSGPKNKKPTPFNVYTQDSEDSQENPDSSDYDSDTLFNIWNEMKQNKDKQDPTNQITNSSDLYNKHLIISDNPNKDLKEYKLSDNYPPIIRVQIGTQFIKAMVDTGACTSVISADIAKTIPGKEIPWPWGNLFSVNGIAIPPKRVKLNVPVKFKNKLVRVHFGVFDNCITPKIILGMDYINKLQLIIFSKERLITTKDLFYSKLRKTLEKSKLIQSINNNKQVVETETQTYNNDFNSSDEPLIKKNKSNEKLNKHLLIQKQEKPLEKIKTWDDDMFLKPLKERILPKILMNQAFNPNETRLIQVKLPLISKEIFITTELLSAKKNGWKVEEGIVIPNKEIMKFYITQHLITT